MSHDPQPYRRRLAALYAALALTLMAAVAGLVAALETSAPSRPTSSSSWKPTPADTATMMAQITRHVADSYRLNSSGSQVVGIIPSQPEVTSGTNQIKIEAIGILPNAQSTTFSSILSTNGTYQLQFCEFDPGCWSTTSRVSAALLELLRREALAIALYSFDFVPGVSAIVVFMPPPAGEASPTLLYFEKNKLETTLSPPLAKALTTPRSNANPSESVINQLTHSSLFAYTVQSESNGTAALILFPTAT